MAQNRQYFTTAFAAAEDLNSHQYFAVTIADGKIANDGDEATGVLMNKPKSGETVSCGYMGEMAFQAGAAIAKDADITVTTSGYFITTASGSYTIGKALSAVTSGSVGRGLFNFVVPFLETS